MYLNINQVYVIVQCFGGGRGGGGKANGFECIYSTFEVYNVNNCSCKKSLKRLPIVSDY